MVRILELSSPSLLLLQKKSFEYVLITITNYVVFFTYYLTLNIHFTLFIFV
jgi:hypothetical protein